MENVRLAAIRELRAFDPRAAKERLARLLLDDPSWEIRVQAARALGETGEADVKAALEAALEDPNEFVRGAAANSLKVHRGIREGRSDPREDRAG